MEAAIGISPLWGIVVMQILYSDEPMKLEGFSVFMAGPSPRSADVESWRPEGLRLLEKFKFNGLALVPERKNWEAKGTYMNQVEWEYEGLENCTLVIVWIPRNLVTLPGFTTNIEFGRYVGSGRMLYGRPDGAPNTRYLDWLYEKLTNRKPENSLTEFMKLVAEKSNG
jgi:hypothetical protein